jgi:hypothetical protein
MAGASRVMTANPVQQQSFAGQGALYGSAGAAANPMNQASMAQQGALAGTAMAGMYQPQQVQTRFNTPMIGTSGYTPSVGTSFATPSVTAGQLGSTNLSPYLNPYTQNVIGGLQTEANRAMQMGSNQLGTAATRAGAFGGSRHGIAEGQMMGDIQRGLNQQTGQLLQSGFQNAQQAAQFDIGQGMQAQQLNQQAAANDLARRLQAQGMNQTAALQVAQRQLQAGQLNQSAIQQAQKMGLQGQQLNQAAGLQGAQFGLNAAQQLGNLGKQSFGYGQSIQQNLMQQGTAQQALQQALIDAAKGQYAGYQQAPVSGLGIMTQALGASPHGQTQTGTRQLGLMDYLTAGASIYAMSDVRLKESIKKVGELANGIGVYTWKWTKEAIESGKAGSMFKGVLAQEVRKQIPDAVVVGQDGYMRVNYNHPELKGAI